MLAASVAAARGEPSNPVDAASGEGPITYLCHSPDQISPNQAFTAADGGGAR